LLGATAALCATVSCGGSAPPARQPTDGPRDPDELKGMTVYDADGNQQTCQRPARDCPPKAPNREFMDACTLAGYRTVKCGCETQCTGKVDRQVYDAAGQAKACAPVDESCTPPPVGAAFQDACIERGYHLAQCGCEWVCSGDPTE
jgi:hypothetical protein